jgi:hypothetical protein
MSLGVLISGNNKIVARCLGTGASPPYHVERPIKIGGRPLKATLLFDPLSVRAALPLPARKTLNDYFILIFSVEASKANDINLSE